MDPFLGEIRIFAGSYAPNNWAFCNGAILPISHNTPLFSILGTTYGGDGKSTFALPNLQGRVPLHFGQGAGLSMYTLGETDGKEAVTLAAEQLAAHTHALNGTPIGADTDTPVAASLFADAAGSRGQKGPAMYAPDTPQTALLPQALLPTGGNQPVPIVKPVLAINYIIALVGIFPQRP